MVPFDPVSLEEDAFLSGPERYEAWLSEDSGGELLDIDPIFGKHFTDILKDFRRYDPDGLIVDDTAPRTPSLAAPGYRFDGTSAGVILIFNGGEMVGGYLGSDISIETEHQGLGLGAELVLEYAMRNGGLPTWGLDEAAYSPAGEAAHRAAWRLAHDRDLFARKAAALIP